MDDQQPPTFAQLATTPGALPQPTHDPHKRVTPFELFFDLVFVFAFTQVTALMVDDPTWGGLARGMLVLVALWWAWVGYAWLATTTDLELGAPRLATIGVMCAMLVVGVATPLAFGEHALAFGVSFAAVRALHIIIYAFCARADPALLRNVLLLGPGAAIGSALIIAAAWQDTGTAMWMWLVALVFEFGGPLFIDTDNWTVNPAHFAERFGLIYIIALGESLIAIGIGASELPIDLTFVALCSCGVISVTTLWWSYFDVVAIVAERRITTATPSEQTAIARDSYTFLHLPMVAGVILFALGVKKALSHPEEHMYGSTIAGLVGGIALYLLGHVAFRYRNIHTLNRQRVVAIAVLAVLGVGAGPHVSGGALVVLVTLVMVSLVAYEATRFREMRARVRSRWWEHSDTPPPRASA